MGRSNRIGGIPSAMFDWRVHTYHALEGQINFGPALCKTAQEELQDLCRRAANGEFPLMKQPQHLCLRLRLSIFVSSFWFLSCDLMNRTSCRFMLKELPKRMSSFVNLSALTPLQVPGATGSCHQLRSQCYEFRSQRLELWSQRHEFWSESCQFRSQRHHVRSKSCQFRSKSCQFRSKSCQFWSQRHHVRSERERVLASWILAVFFLSTPARNCSDTWHWLESIRHSMKAHPRSFMKGDYILGCFLFFRYYVFPGKPFQDPSWYVYLFSLYEIPQVINLSSRPRWPPSPAEIFNNHLQWINMYLVILFPLLVSGLLPQL